jgi:PAS domain S-box-containing protein
MSGVPSAQLAIENEIHRLRGQIAGLERILAGKTAQESALSDSNGSETPVDESHKVLAELVERAPFGISTRLREMEAALRESDWQYRSLFESIEQGFCTIEMFFDENEKPVDFRFLLVNPAFERQTGIQNAAGRRIREIVPLLEEHWFEMYGRVALTGEPLHFENASTRVPGYYEVFAWRIGAPSERKVAILFNDVSERKRTEQELAADVAALSQIHSLSTSLLESAELEPLLQRIMDAAVNIMGADRGTLKLVKGDSLLIVAHHGHERPYLDFFNSFEGRVSVAEAMKCGDRAIIEDVESNPFFVGSLSLAVLREAGVRAINSTPLRSRNGALLGVLTTQWSVPHVPAEHDLWRVDLLVRQAADLIEHNRAERALLRVAQLPERNPDPVLRVAPGGALDYANAAARSWLAGMGVAEDQPLPGGLKGMIESLGSERPVIEGEVSDQRGRTYLFTAVHRSDEGTVTFYGRDITDRKRVEEALRESEQRLRLAQDAAGIGVFEWNIQTGVNTWTPKMEQLYGLPVGTFAQTEAAWENLVHPEDRAGAVKLVEQAFETGAPSEGEWRVVWPDGSVHRLSARWQVFKDAEGTPVRMTGVNIDITDRKEAEERLQRAERLQSIGALAGGMAHDYNNLMSIILLHADTATEELSNGESAVDSVAAIRDAAERAVELGRQLMAFSSKQVLQTEVLNINSVTTETKKLVQRLIGDDVTVTFNPGSGLGLVKADRGQLVQIIMNLAVNARDAMPHGGALIIETANVEFDASEAQLNPEQRQGPYVMLAIRDTGFGIDKATQARMFEPFFTTKAIGKGTGLGLSVVYGIVKQSGGFISVSSELGHGAEFRIYLPAVLEMPSPILYSEPQPVPGGCETVLLVEDEPALQQKICEVLQNAGYRVLSAADGAQALRLALEEARPIQLLLTDVVMPNVSGPRLAERLRTTRPDTKALYMSGYPDMGEGSEALRSQPNFIQKPFTQEELLRRIRKVLDSNTAQE